VQNTKCDISVLFRWHSKNKFSPNNYDIPGLVWFMVFNATFNYDIPVIITLCIKSTEAVVFDFSRTSFCCPVKKSCFFILLLNFFWQTEFSNFRKQHKWHLTFNITDKGSLFDTTGIIKTVCPNKYDIPGLVWFMVFNATFNYDIPVIITLCNTCTFVLWNTFLLSKLYEEIVNLCHNTRLNN
jgi:hypothetical protein